MNVIPAIDLCEGQCVRLYQGRFERQTNYNKEPVSLAREYEAMGFNELHIVDLDGARIGRQQNEAIIQRIANATQSTIQLGGGLRSASQLEFWLNSGVHRVVIGSLAVVQAPIVRDWLARYGPEKIVLALDVTIEPGAAPRVVTHGWSRTADMTLWQCLDIYMAAGLRHLLCTDISRDGALTGPNLELYTQLIDRYPGILLQASGGVRSIEDLHALKDIGTHAAISGRALLDGKITAAEIETFLPAA
jgi:phosphoribosylformimino-5-aminoimidazole carboxamide ribotide isomerase